MKKSYDTVWTMKDCGTSHEYYMNSPNYTKEYFSMLCKQ
jgi:hypothetical protein